MSHRFEPPADALHDAKLRARIAAHWGFERPTVDALLATALVRRFARGSAIYPQGTHRGSLFIVLAGDVSLSVLLPNGQRILCAFYQPATIFGFPIGETARPRWSAAEAFTPATVALVPRREFERILAAAAPAAVMRFFNILLERQARLAMRLVHCLALDLRGRLALTLVDLATSFGTADAGGIRVTLPLTHENLADMVGASRERISKAMAALLADGLITYSRQAITVRDLDGLRDVATPAG
jgi:CRP/FNR family transcriptional regulator, cyclic AMP receptor protein